MISEIIMALVGLVCGGLSSLITFIFTKRKYNAEVDSQQIQNMKESFEVYKQMMEESLEAQKSRFEGIIESQDKKITELQEENSQLRTQVDTLKNQLINFFGEQFKRSSTELHGLQEL